MGKRDKESLPLETRVRDLNLDIFKNIKLSSKALNNYQYLKRLQLKRYNDNFLYDYGN